MAGQICKRCGGHGWVMVGYGETAGADECPVCISGCEPSAVQLAADIKEAIVHLSGGRNFPNLLKAVDDLAALAESRNDTPHE